MRESVKLGFEHELKQFLTNNFQPKKKKKTRRRWKRWKYIKSEMRIRGNGRCVVRLVTPRRSLSTPVFNG